MTCDVRALDAQQAQIGYPGAGGFVAGVADPAEKALGPDVIAFGMLKRHRDQEGTLAAAQIHLNGGFPGEQSGHPDGPEKIFRHVLESR
jgi:hypothetical protein